MIEVFIDKRFGVRQRIAIERHVRDPIRNVLPRKQQLYAAGYRSPNYPMPAIPVSAGIGRYWVMIKNRYTLKIYQLWHRRTDGSIGWFNQ